MHTDTALHLGRLHEGQIPASWNDGPTDFQKAKFIALTAWHLTRDPADPELPACDITHQTNCIGIVESIMRGNAPDNTPFALKAKELWDQVDPNNKENSNVKRLN